MISNDRRPVLPASSRGLDFISSSNGDVVFGYNEDGEAFSADEEEEEEEEEGEEGDGYSSTSSDDYHKIDQTKSNVEPSVRTILYIQMQYCKQEVIPLSHILHIIAHFFRLYVILSILVYIQISSKAGDFFVKSCRG